MDEAQIISGLRACSAEAHEALYDAYAGGLYDYCSALLQDDAAAAVALRETLLHAAASTESMPAGCSLRAWLYALARGRCRAGGERMIEHPMPEDDPSARLLIAVLGTLTARDREVLELTGRHGLGETDLEPVLGLPPDRVASLLADARRRFDQAMAEELDRTGPVEYPSLAGISEGDDPLALLYRALPYATPPSGQRPRILDDLLIAGTTGTVPAAFTVDLGSVPPPSTTDVPARGRPRPRRRRALLLGGATAAVVIVATGVIVGVTRFSGPSEDQTESAAVPTGTTQPTVDPTTLSSRSPNARNDDIKHRTTPSTTPTAATPSHPARTGPHHANRRSPHTRTPAGSANHPPGTSTSPPRPPATTRPPTPRHPPAPHQPTPPPGDDPHPHAPPHPQAHPHSHHPVPNSHPQRSHPYGFRSRLTTTPRPSRGSGAWNPGCTTTRRAGFRRVPGWGSVQGAMTGVGWKRRGGGGGGVISLAVWVG